MPVYAVRYVPSGHKSGGLATISVATAEPMTVAGLLSHLVKSGDLSPLETGHPEAVDSYLILVNGRSFHSLDGPDTLLVDGDTLSILIPVSGG